MQTLIPAASESRAAPRRESARDNAANIARDPHSGAQRGCLNPVLLAGFSKRREPGKLMSQERLEVLHENHETADRLIGSPVPDVGRCPHCGSQEIRLSRQPQARLYRLFRFKPTVENREGSHLRWQLLS
jgi:hypothetical protein